MLVLSERRQHLLDLAEALAEQGVDHGFYWGGVKQAALEAAADKRVVLGTYHMASEGMDVPALNTVILALPKSDVQQSVGRILRRTDHPVVPTVVDIVDGRLPCFRRQHLVRRKFYKQCKFVDEGAPEQDGSGEERDDEGVAAGGGGGGDGGGQGKKGGRDEKPAARYIFR